MQIYRGVKIEEDTYGAVATGGIAGQKATSYRAKVKNKHFSGSLDEVKRKIDEELGPESPPAKK